VIWRLALEVLGQVHGAAPRSHLVPLLACWLVLAPLGAVVALRLAGSRTAAALGALAGTALALAVSLTLFRYGGQPGGLWRLRTCAVTDPVLLSGDGLANLALFAPAAFLAVLAVGRPVRVAAGVSVVSVTVEVLQALRNVGVCDTSDALLNTLGGLAAVTTAALLRSGVAAVSGSVPCRRSC
jgi:hypothetical protein